LANTDSTSASRGAAEAADGDRSVEIGVPRSVWEFAYAGATVPCLVLVAAASTPGGDTFALLAALMLGAFAAVSWAVGFVVSAIVRRLRLGRAGWARWLGIPMMGALAFALACSPLPLWARFQASRSAFEDAVVRIQAGQSVEPGRIGLYEVSSVSVDDGDVWFEVRDACLPSSCGFVYVPGDPLGRPDADSVARVDGLWWQWINYW
jgi:hypothetical protein